MLAIRLPPELEQRLDALARRTGRSKSYYVREAIAGYMDDLEDLYLAERRLEDLRAGHTDAVALAELMQRYGVED
jgi:RHH-type rel operon transcriptional repressor/antitoxin RelB